VIVLASRGRDLPETIAIPMSGGMPRLICHKLCWVWWSGDEKTIYVNVPPRTLVIPLAPDRVLPDLPPAGLDTPPENTTLGAARVIDHADVRPGYDQSTYVFVKTEMNQNIYRVPLHGSD
jgi:hypothetical protein